MNKERMSAGSAFLRSIMLATVLGLSLVLPAGAFSLLGPVQPWMQASNGVIQPGDIGGPMEIGCGYRWNVPVVTYGFDQSFLDFFGTNGVAAVEAAIKMLNDLPPASSLELTNYPFNVVQGVSSPLAGTVIDLKSQTLSMLLEQLGLTEPSHNIYVLREYYPYVNGNIGSIIVYGIPVSYDTRQWQF